MCRFHNKKHVFLMLSLAMALLLGLFLMSGCTTQQQAPRQMQTPPSELNGVAIQNYTEWTAPASQTKNGNAVTAPVATAVFTYCNGIEPQQLEYTKEAKQFPGLRYVQISGLKDEIIQEKINQKILDGCIALY